MTTSRKHKKNICDLLSSANSGTVVDILETVTDCCEAQWCGYCPMQPHGRTFKLSFDYDLQSVSVTNNAIHYMCVDLTDLKVDMSRTCYGSWNYNLLEEIEKRFSIDNNTFLSTISRILIRDI